MTHLRTALVLVIIATGTLACSLVSGQAQPATSVPASPTIVSTEPPAATAAVEPTGTPEPTQPPAPSDTPDPLMQNIPAPYTNLMGVAQFFNPVGQPVQTWNGIPIMPEATAGQEFKGGGVYSFKGNLTISQAVRFYLAAISKLGYQLNGAAPATGSSGLGSNTMHESTMFCYKGTDILVIYIAAFDSDTAHAIVVISK